MAKKHSISLYGYLSKNFTTSFMTVFLPLFFIGSLVFIIKISALTASIKITFLEMLQLFSYNLPLILFYILPVTFLIAIVTMLLRLSHENELIALFSLGDNANAILKRLLFVATLFSLILLLLSVALIPKTKQQFRAFQIEKMAQAQVNINPSKLGQKFGDLFIYVNNKKGTTLNDVVIYNKSTKKAQLFVAKQASFDTNQSLVTLTLSHGSGYTFSSDTIEEVNYESMSFFKGLNSKSFTYNNIIDYWKALSKSERKKRRILFFIFVSLIPIMALYVVAAFSIINPRYNKNYAYQILGVSTITLFGIASLLEKHGSFSILFAIFIGVIIVGYLLFKRNVLRYF